MSKNYIQSFGIIIRLERFDGLGLPNVEYTLITLPIRRSKERCKINKDFKSIQCDRILNHTSKKENNCI